MEKNAGEWACTAVEAKKKKKGKVEKQRRK